VHLAKKASYGFLNELSGSQALRPLQGAVSWGYASACCNSLCESLLSSTLAIRRPQRHEGRFTDTPLGLYGASTPCLEGVAAGYGRGVLACR